MNLHPAFVHFPIALLVASFMFELIGVVAKDESFRKAALYCLLIALFGAGAAYFTGLTAAVAASAIPNIERAVDEHQQAAILTLVLLGVLLLGRIAVEARPRFRRVGSVIYLLAALIAVMSVLRTGYMGAELVRRHGAGVEPVLRRYTQPERPSPEKQPGASQRGSGALPQ